MAKEIKLSKVQFRALEKAAPGEPLDFFPFKRLTIAKLILLGLVTWTGYDKYQITGAGKTYLKNNHA
jgi:hypothetical protein